jgi:hypothetical protein
MLSETLQSVIGQICPRFSDNVQPISLRGPMTLFVNTLAIACIYVITLNLLTIELAIYGVAEAPREGMTVAFFKGTRNEHEMMTKAFKAFMLILSATLMASAFIPSRTPNPPRSLMLLGAGLVSMATLTRRHFADEE